MSTGPRPKMLALPSGLLYDQIMSPRAVEVLESLGDVEWNEHGTKPHPGGGPGAHSRLRTLPGLLEREGIRHVFMGDSLGGKPADRELYDDNGTPDYGKIASQPAFQKGIEEGMGVAADSRMALMCAEEDPSGCHRTLLIGPALEGRGVALVHIRRT